MGIESRELQDVWCCEVPSHVLDASNRQVEFREAHCVAWAVSLRPIPKERPRPDHDASPCKAAVS